MSVSFLRGDGLIVYENHDFDDPDIEGASSYEKVDGTVATSLKLNQYSEGASHVCLTKQELVAMLTLINRHENALKTNGLRDESYVPTVGDTVTYPPDVFKPLKGLTIAKEYVIRSTVANGSYIKFEGSVGAFPVEKFNLLRKGKDNV